MRNRLQFFAKQPSGFSPSQLSGLIFWLKADAITGLNDNDPVNTWNDSSSSANNASKGSYVAPTYKTNQMNGKPVVRFNGSTTGLLTTNILNPTHVSAIAVVKLANDQTSRSFVFTYANVCGWGLGISDGTTNRVKFFTAPGSNESGALTAGTTYAVSGTLGASGDSKYYLNNNLQSTLPGQALAYVSGGDPVKTGIGMLGDYNTQFFNGDIAEIIVYNREITSTERGQIQSYLASKYGL